MNLHYALTKLAITLGPSSRLVRLLIQRKCREAGCELHLADTVFELRKGDEAMLLSQQQFIYIPNLAAQFDAVFSSVIPTLITGRALVDFSQPRLHTYRKSGLQFEMPSFPEEEAAIEAYFRWYTPKRGDLVYDVGAHCGYSTYHFSKLVGSSGRVIAFEPDSVNFPILLRNLERHKLDNVLPVQAAISDRSGTASFNHEGTTGSCLSHASARATVGRVEKVKTMTIEQAFAQWGIPSFCKIDIEGAEIPVLRQATPQLRGQPIHFVVDSCHIVNGETTASRVEESFRESGFEVESALVSGLTTTWARPRIL